MFHDPHKGMTYQESSRSYLIVVVNDILDPVPHFLRYGLTMLQAEAVGDPPVVDNHSRLPFLLERRVHPFQRRAETPGADQFVPRLPRDPCVVAAPEEDEVGVDGVAFVGAGFGSGAPDFLTPFVVGDHVHFILGEIEGFLDADGGLNERGGGAGGVLGEAHDEPDEVVEDVGGDRIQQAFDNGAGYECGARDAEESRGNNARGRAGDVRDCGEEEDAADEVEVLISLALDLLPVAADDFQENVGAYGVAHENDFGRAAGRVTDIVDTSVQEFFNVGDLFFKAGKLRRAWSVLDRRFETGERVPADVEVACLQG